jgi:hypothetical protein
MLDLGRSAHSDLRVRKRKSKRIGLLEMNGKKTYCKGVSSNTPEAD